MDTYEGSIYDPDSLHKYLYANGNPVKYNDPSGNFFSAVEGIVATTINTIADNYRTFQVMGLISGFAKATIAAASGCSPEEITREFIDGYCMGFGVGALMYIAAACTALSIAQIFMFDAGFKSVMYLVLYIVAVTTNHPEDALIYYTLSILSLFTFAKLYKANCTVDIIGDKGNISIARNYRNPEVESSTKPSSKILRNNMIASGQIEPNYKNAAHHIVAGSSPKAEEARSILVKFNIDINSSENGVFLPTEKGVSNASYHPSLHTNEYYSKVNNLLKNADTREDAIDILDLIREELLDGIF